MKRAIPYAMALAAFVATAGLTACDKQDDTPKSNPRLDGVQPIHAETDTSILENQADAYRKQHPVATPPAPAAPATPATATAPAEGGAAPETAPAAPGDAAPAN